MADLNTTVCGIEFPNPVWTAAGPGGADGRMLLRAARGGAGGLVAKTISVQPAEVPQPNIVSPFAGSLLNAELWSELDYRRFIAEELPAARTAGRPVIASVGYSAAELALLGRELEAAGAADAVEFSIHYTGKDPDTLRRLAAALKETVSIPVLAKLSPAVGELEPVIGALQEVVDGFVAINSVGPALDFDPETRAPSVSGPGGRGWLSGGAILPIALHYVEAISALTDKPVIGVGGVRRPVDVVKMLQAGASAVQVCSLAVLKGQAVYGRLASGLSAWLDAHGYSAARQIVGLYRRERGGQPRPGGPLYPAIDPGLCNLCGLCERSCIHEAIHFEEELFHLDKERCVGCGLCCSLCPKAALALVAEGPEAEGKRERRA